MRKAIVLLSGGQDSTTCLLWAISKFKKENVIAVGFGYGQKHKIELRQANTIASLLGVPYKIFDLKGLLGGSSLTDTSQSVNDPHKINKDLPSSFTAGRNALFLTIAASYGYNQFGDKTELIELITGVCQTDGSGYPDCRQGFIEAQQKAVCLALDFDIVINAPLMYLTKAETWKLAADLGKDNDFNIIYNGRILSTVDLIQEFTMTDYNGSLVPNEWGFGKLDNPASEIRAKGFYEAKAKGWI